MKQNNNWCCEITSKTFKLFQEKKLYENVWERSDIFHYWREIDIEKQFCQKCQKITEKEKTRFEADAKKEEEELDKIIEKCDNCEKLIKKTGRQKIEKRIIYRYCNEHRKNDSCVALSSDLCSPKCLKEVEGADKQHWLQKATIKDLNEEIWRREKLH